MYQLLCRNEIVGLFNCKKNIFSEEYVWVGAPTLKYVDIIGDIDIWIKSRHFVKHRRGLQELARKLKLSDTETLLSFTHALSLSDPFWVKTVEESCTWKTLNLYDNKFADLVVDAPIHLEGTIPDFTVDGSLEKCWIQRDGLSYLLKTGTRCPDGSYLREPFAEECASKLADILGYRHVTYTCHTYEGRVVSVCRNMTNPEMFLLPISKYVVSTKFDAVVRFCESYGFVEELAEYVVLDALIRNPDRHLGNIGVLVNTDTLAPIGLAPVFDNGMGFCATWADAESYTDFSKSMNYKFPKLYDDFDSTALFFRNSKAFKALKRVTDFEFAESELGFPSRQLCLMSSFISHKAAELLDREEL